MFWAGRGPSSPGEGGGVAWTLDFRAGPTRCPPLHTPHEAHRWGHLSRTGCWGEAHPCLGGTAMGPALRGVQAGGGPQCSPEGRACTPRRKAWGPCLLSAQCRGPSVLGQGLLCVSSPQNSLGPQPTVVGLEFTSGPRKEVSYRVLPVRHRVRISMPKCWMSRCEALVFFRSSHGAGQRLPVP